MNKNADNGSMTNAPLLKTGWKRIVWRLNTFRFQILGIVIASVLIPSFIGGWFASSRINDLLKEQVYSEIESRTQMSTAVVRIAKEYLLPCYVAGG